MNICLRLMTESKMHEFFKSFRYDPMAIQSEYPEEYIYDNSRVDAYFEKHRKQGKIHFAIMLDNTVIGDIYMKDIDEVRKSCTIGIYMVNDNYKGKGYGTQAERLMLRYAFSEMRMNIVYADTLIKNTRSQHVLEKAGFVKIREDTDKYYYECLKGTRAVKI